MRKGVKNNFPFFLLTQKDIIYYKNIYIYKSLLTLKTYFS